MGMCTGLHIPIFFVTSGWKLREEIPFALRGSRSESKRHFSRGGSIVAARCQFALLSVCSNRMKRHVLIFGIVGGVLVTLLQWTEYRFLVIEHSFEIYGALVAAMFAGLGIWLGIRLNARRQDVVVREIVVTRGDAFVLNERKREELGITPRELEILSLVAEGLSNREIATRLFVSENTVKTHCSRAFEKLGAKRRTQAVQLGRELGLLAETGRPNG
jgi:NarL family two-component system response regulator LiaR